MAVIVFPGAAHALIGVKLNPEMYSLQQQIHAKFHPDRSTYGSDPLEKYLVKQKLTVLAPLKL